MTKMIVKHELAISERECWMADFERKKSVREACGISQNIDPAIYFDESGELVVIHEVRALTIKDAIRVLDHIRNNAASREKANAKGGPLFSE
jgi:hypothetical protein